MSRNFELLQKLGKEQELLGSLPIEPASGLAAAAATASAPGFAAPAVPPKPGLEEITGIVQQVFLMPGASAPRTARHHDSTHEWPTTSTGADQSSAA